MSKHYAQLTLYYGLCCSDGISSGSLKIMPGDPESGKRYSDAMKRIEMHLMGNSGIEFGIEKLVNSEEEAGLLIAFAQEKIKGAYPIIEPVDCSHEMLRFYRKIGFDGWKARKEKKLISELKKSGITPHNQDRYWIDNKYRGELSKADKKKREKEIKKLDPDKPWKTALKFYTAKKSQ